MRKRGYLGELERSTRRNKDGALLLPSPEAVVWAVDTIRQLRKDLKEARETVVDLTQQTCGPGDRWLREMEVRDE